VGNLFPFIGVGRDPIDGTIPDAGLVFSDSIEGVLGTGSGFAATLSVAGTHVVTLTATNSRGLTGTDAITLYMTYPDGGGLDGPDGGGPQGPVVRINHPGTGEKRVVGVDIPFTGSAMDPLDGALTGSALVWTGSQSSTPFGTGQSFSAQLPLGVNVVTLTATDSLGLTGTDTITLYMTYPDGGM
jgi:hypothetical protein